MDRGTAVSPVSDGDVSTTSSSSDARGYVALLHQLGSVKSYEEDKNQFKQAFEEYSPLFHDNERADLIGESLASSIDVHSNTGDDHQHSRDAVLDLDENREPTVETVESVDHKQRECGRMKTTGNTNSSSWLTDLVQIGARSTTSSSHNANITSSRGCPGNGILDNQIIQENSVPSSSFLPGAGELPKNTGDSNGEDKDTGHSSAILGEKCKNNENPADYVRVSTAIRELPNSAAENIRVGMRDLQVASKQVGQAVMDHPYVNTVHGVVHGCWNESVNFAADRAKQFSEIYLSHILGDDPESQYQRRLQTASFVKDRSIGDKSGIYEKQRESMLLKAHMTSIPWLDRQLLYETRDESYIIQYDEELDAYNIVLKERNEKGLEDYPVLAAALKGDEDALAILNAKLTPPAFEEMDVCFQCKVEFSVSSFRHHCRHCGKSFCSAHSGLYRKILKFGYINPTRVCDACAIYIDDAERLDRILWRSLRVQGYLEDNLIPYFEPVVDRNVDKAMRLAEGALYVVKNTLILNYPASIAINAVDILRRYGMNGLAGVLMRKDFVDAVEALKKISGLEERYPISLQELTACIYYKLAVERGLRGCRPNAELEAHTSILSHTGKNEIVNNDIAERVLHYERTGVDIANTDNSCMHEGNEQLPSSPVLPKRANDEDIDMAIRYAPLALEFVYHTSNVEVQRLAASQGWATLYIKHTTEAEQPAFALFASMRGNLSFDDAYMTEVPQTSYVPARGHVSSASSTAKNEKVAVLAIRGTSSVHDVVTDIRAAPDKFPPEADDIKQALFGEVNKDVLESKSAVATMQALIESFIKSQTTSTNDSEDSPKAPVSEVSSDWEWLNVSSDMTYASGGIARAALWILLETGPSLVKLIEEGYSIRVVGHSLGGAVSALLVHMLKDAYRNKHKEESKPPKNFDIDVYGVIYGCPSFVDAVTADALKESVLSIVLHDDIIPRVTPQSIRVLMKELMNFRENVFKYIKQDWSDVITRAGSLWKPRARYEVGIQETDLSFQNQHNDFQKQSYKSLQNTNLDNYEINSSMDHGVDSSEHGEGNRMNDGHETYRSTVDQRQDIENQDLPPTLQIIFPSSQAQQDAESDPSVIVEEDELISLWQPGRIVHIYSHRGIYLASEISKDAPDLRRIEVQGNLFNDHSSKNIFEALLEVRSVRQAQHNPPTWVAYDALKSCQVCGDAFTWHSTFRGEAQEYRERYNCRNCGGLVCGPCSEKRHIIPRIGLINPSRICDTCFYKGDFSNAI